MKKYKPEESVLNRGDIANVMSDIINIKMVNMHYIKVHIAEIDYSVVGFYMASVVRETDKIIDNIFNNNADHV